MTLSPAGLRIIKEFEGLSAAGRAPCYHSPT